MNLMTLDFWGIVLLVLAAGILLFGYRLAFWLAIATERLIAFLTQTGLHGLAKILLGVLIGYNERTYRKSRFIFWNQVHVRFAFLWGSLLVMAGVLFLLKQGHKVNSISQPLALIAAAYIGYRSFIYWALPRRPHNRTIDPALTNLIQDVNERITVARPGRQLLRRWDYLDELYAEPA